MKLLNWFDAREAQDYGRMLARIVIDTVPVAAEVKETVFRKKALRTLEKLTRHIAQAKPQQSFNTYKKARLGNAFKWALRDAGFPQAYVDELTQWLMLRI